MIESSRADRNSLRIVCENVHVLQSMLFVSETKGFYWSFSTKVQDEIHQYRNTTGMLPRLL